MASIKIIGAGLAGSECAWALAQRGHTVDLHEMRPVKSTAAHATSNLGELVCSNSFRSSAPTNAVGLLKKELALMGSLVLRCGEEARVPAGDAFAVDRERFEKLLRVKRGHDHAAVDLHVGTAGNDADRLSLFVVHSGGRNGVGE